MISEIRKLDDKLFSQLVRNHYTRRIKSHYLAYGNSYDFCRFYQVCQNDETVAVIACFYSSMMVSSVKDKNLSTHTLDEIADFILLNKPMSVEFEKRWSEHITRKTSQSYSSDVRTEFQFISKKVVPELNVEELPKLSEVFGILKECFPAISTDENQLWLADTSHRVRRGLSQSFMLDKCTTATIQYIIDKTVLIGNVGTIPAERGKHYARNLLYWIGEKLTDDGFDVRLMARPHRVSYYEEIGFKEIDTDIVLERKDND
ncbi:MAG: hypothetical protein Q4D35_04875 [Ruminococcus sp.]|nr:hypothetical protein [Ruminococcus sp.]